METGDLLSNEQKMAYILPLRDKWEAKFVRKALLMDYSIDTICGTIKRYRKAK